MHLVFSSRKYHSVSQRTVIEVIDTFYSDTEQKFDLFWVWIFFFFFEQNCSIGIAAKDTKFEILDDEEVAPFVSFHAFNEQPFLLIDINFLSLYYICCLFLSLYYVCCYLFLMLLLLLLVLDVVFYIYCLFVMLYYICWCLAVLNLLNSWLWLQERREAQGQHRMNLR